MSLYLTTITDTISKLTISGVTIKDKDQIAESWLSLPKVLYPNPNEPGLVTDFSRGFNVAGGLESVSYVLHYRYLSTQVANAFPASYSALIDEAIAIMDALLAAVEDVENVEIAASLDSVGAKEDPVGNVYNGADISIAITELH